MTVNPSAHGTSHDANGNDPINDLIMSEQTDIAAPAANKVVIYCRDNGAGKTQLVARFPTGAVQQIAIEP